jgi:hypothetical protein
VQPGQTVGDLEQGGCDNLGAQHVGISILFEQGFLTNQTGRGIVFRANWPRG